MYLDDWKLDIVQRMNDDGIIYWKGRKGYKKVFNKLERNTGLDFRRTSKDRKAEIVATYTDLNYHAGMCDWYDAIVGGPIRVYTDPEYKQIDGGRYIESHEVGHALGLAHDPPYKSVMETDWDDPLKFFSRQDYTAINNLFF